jgi:tetratricopeptide (TPR) repeat protein
LRARITSELERQVQDSPDHAMAAMRLGAEALALHRYDDARRHLEEALRASARATRVHERLAVIDLVEDRPREALRHVRLERRVSQPTAVLDVIEANAWQRLGNHRRARALYRKALERDAGMREASDSLQSIERNR